MGSSANGVANGGYASAYPEYVPDARQRGRVSIAHVLPASREVAARRNGVPADLVFTSILAKSLLALSIHLVKEWLLKSETAGATIAQIHVWLLVIASIASALWTRPWEALKHRIKIPQLALYAALTCLETLSLLKALEKLPVLRVIMLTQSSFLWTHGVQSMQKKHASTARNANFVAVATIGICYVAELYLNRYLSTSTINGGYLAVLAYLALAASRADLSASVASSAATDAGLSSQIACLGTIGAIPISFLVSLFDTGATRSPATSDLSAVIATTGMLAIALLVVEPMLSASAVERIPKIRSYKLLYPIATLTSIFIGSTAFERTVNVADCVVGTIVYFGVSQILHADPRLVAQTGNQGTVTFSGKASFSKNSTALESLERQVRHVRSTIKTILANPDSKKIYFFLCLNLAFMFVQMMYGIWTNSLGLISDSIHMFFDCLALGMGLLASVMATWPRNETFTYGYARVETLSGFANGVFLILISIFIVFEAIQRLIDPPEMNTNQLLVVSMAGLAVNLVGMFATGHHHHGHSHGGHDHGHSHGHDHDHAHGDCASEDARKDRLTASLRQLSIVCLESPLVNTTTLADLAQAGVSGLTSFTLHGCTRLSDNDVLNFLKRAPHIRHLALEAVSISPTFYTSAAPLLPNLESLRTSHPGRKSQRTVEYYQGLAALVTACEKTFTWFTHYLSGDTERGRHPEVPHWFLTHLVQSCRATLRKIEISGLSLQAISVRDVCMTAKELQQLVLPVDARDLDELQFSLLGLTQLRYLHLVAPSTQAMRISLPTMLSIVKHCSPTLRQIGIQNRVRSIGRTVYKPDKSTVFYEVSEMENDPTAPWYLKNGMRVSLDPWDEPLGIWPEALLVVRT